VVELPVDRPWKLVLTDEQYTRLWAHLFPGDRDEHAAVLHCGVAVSDRHVRLLTRELKLAIDGVDFVRGDRSYKKLRAEFITNEILDHRNLSTVYLAVHNHGGTDRVAFSDVDLNSHERGYPALLDLVNGPPVGAIVCALNAVAGDIWLPNGKRVPLTSTIVVGPQRRVLTPKPISTRVAVDGSFERQTRLFGRVGQGLLQTSKVGVVGLGGVGSLVAQQLGRLGVGEVILIDFDRLELSNVSRVVGSKPSLLLRLLDRLPIESRLRRFLWRFSPRKVDIGARIVREPGSSRPRKIFGSVVTDANAKELIDCDYIFLAGDQHSARLVVNEIGHQYFIPYTQLGAKVPADPDTGEIGEVYSVERPVWPTDGCLWCNGLIRRARLEEEAKSERQLRAQRYVDDPEVRAPSVISLNAVTASLAVNTFLFYLTGLHEPNAFRGTVRYISRKRELVQEMPRKSASCPFCGLNDESAFALGDLRELQTTSLDNS
jgi:hypothetical protein